MSWKRTILAFLTLVTLCLAYFLDLQLAEKRRYQTVNQQSLTPGINKSEVQQVTLRNDHGETLLALDNGNWRIKKPMDAAADPEIIEQLLVNVTGARKRNETEVKNLAEYGLASPEMALFIKTGMGKSFELLLGNESTYTGQVFAKYPNRPEVFTVGEHVRSVLVRRPIDFRKARVMDVDVGALEQYQAISITAKDSNVVLKNDRGNWQITSPVQTPAETDVVHDYLRKVGLLRAAGFLSAESDKPTSVATAIQALANPTYTVSFERSNAPVTRLLIASVGESSAPVYVAQRMGEDELLLLRQESIDAIVQDENYFRSRTLFQMKSPDVGMFSIQIGVARTDLVRNEQGLWEFMGDPARRVDQDKVNLRLESLLSARIQEYEEMNPRDLTVFGLQPPRMRFTVISKDRARTEGLDTGRSEAGQVTSVYAKRRNDPGVFTMELSSELVIVPDMVADKRFARTNVAQLDHFEIEIDEKRYAFKREGEWKMLKPAQTAYTTVDVTKLERFLRVLNEIEFEKDFSAGRETVITSFDNPSLIVRLFGTGDKELLSLTVGKRLENSSFVTTGQDRKFEVPNTEIDRLLSTAQSLIQ